MRIYRLSLAVLCVISLALTGCGKSSNGSGNAQMRILNAFSEAPALNVTIGTTSAASGLPFESTTQYVSVPSGSQIATVGVSGASTTLINTTYTLNSGTNYSYVVFGTSNGVGALLNNDQFNDPGAGFFALRVDNAAPGQTGIDVYITAPGGDISSSAPTFTNLAYGTISALASIAIGTSFEIRVTPNGTKEVIFDSTPQTFAEHSGTDLVVFGKGSGKLVNAAILHHDTAGTGAVVDNLLTQYKVINASLVPSALNVFVDGSLQLSNIPFTGVSNYQKTSSGAHTFDIEATSTPGASLLTLTPTLASATDTSIVLTGTAGALVPLVLNDDNLPPPIGTAGVRIVNASATSTAFDVFVNFSKQVSGLAVGAASPYLNFNAAANVGTVYEFDFNVTGTTTAVLKLTNVALASGHKYTIYLAGPSSGLQGIVTQDL
jgi:Domain of unknown function (DUF4397)